MSTELAAPADLSTPSVSIETTADASAYFPPPASFVVAAPEESAIERPPVRVVELVALVALVGLADLTLYWGSGGIGDGVLMTVASAIVLLASPIRRPSARVWAAAALVAGLAARSLWQGSGWTLFLGLSGIFAIAVALRTRRSYVPEIFVSGMVSAVSALGQLWSYVAGAFRLATAGRMRGVRWAPVLVPLAVVTVFALVFMAANPLLGRWAGLAWDAMSGGHFFSPTRVAFWLLAAAVAAGLLAPRVRELRLSERLGPGNVIEGDLQAPAETSVAIARNVLLGVNVLFLAYNALDVVYLWAGTPPPGIDHTSYAHQGTAWLTVSLFLSTLVLGLVFRRGMNARTDETRLVRTLGLVWAAQNFVLAAGTFRRIAMYVDDSGLTMLRCLAIAGVGVVAVAFGLIVVKVARRHTALWLLRSQFDAFLIALVIWTVLPIDSMVWSFNAARIDAGQDRPLLHLYEQHVSAEGVAPIASLLDHEDPVVARGVASRLLNLREGLLRERAAAPRWTQGEIARRRALATLDAALPRIRELVPDGQASTDGFNALQARAYRANGADPAYDNSWRF